MKPFSERKIKANGKLLPIEDFRLFCDMDSPTADPKKARAIIEKAEAALLEPIPFLHASHFREYTTSGNRSRYENPYFKRRDMALWLALGEHLEGKGRFTEKLMDAVWAILEESTWVVPAHMFCYPVDSSAALCPVFGEEGLHGIDLFAATTAACLATVYHLAGAALDGISPIITKKLGYLLHERIIKPYLTCTFWWTGETGRRINNWAPWISSNILYVAALTEPERSVREQVVNRAIRTLDNFMDGYAPDGGCDEGPAYWGSAGGSLFDCLEIIEDMSGGKITLWDEPLVRNIGEYIYKVNINGKRFVNFADCAPTASPPPSMLLRYGRKCGSPHLEAFAVKLAAEGDFNVTYWQMYRGLKSLYSTKITPRDCEMPLSTYLPGLKVMTARELADTSRGTFLAVKGGHNNEEHNHNDVGSFVVYRNGNPVLIDTGVGTYTAQTFSADRYKLWFMQSGYHNLPSFGGVDQKNGAEFRSSGEVYDEACRSLTMELANAYPEEAGLISFTRAASLSGDTVTVTDRYRLRAAEACEFHLMSATLPVATGDGKIALAEGMTLAYDTTLECEIEEHDPVGMNAERLWGTSKLYRIKFRAYGEGGSYAFRVYP